MITEGEAAIPLETTLHAFRNQEKTKQRSTIAESIRGVEIHEKFLQWQID